MTAPFLATKLYIPLLRPNVVSRPRLLQRLDEGLRLGRRLTLVSAPAGFGKTTLITEWIYGSAREVAWISLDEGDDDPIQFLRYLIAALQQVDGSIGRTLQQLLRAPQLPPPQSLITPLINDVAAADAAVTLVLDDYHLTTSPTIHQIVQFMLEHQPPSMHTVINTRRDPPLSLIRLRVRDQVTEVREGDLRFTAKEATAFLNQTMDLSLSPDAVDTLAARTEGWIAGLQLAALALQEEQTAARAGAFISDFAGDDHHVIDYLVTEVLQRQTEAVRDFLRQTSILDRLTVPLCDTVTGRRDSEAMLEQLERANLFLTALDRHREWYRYDRLFAEFLRAGLDQREREHLHHRAARWFETHGFVSQAIHHALAYASTSGDLDDAQRLIRTAAEGMIHSGGVLTVRGWLDALPEDRVRADGELAIYRGWIQATTGEMAIAEEYADAAEACLRQAAPPLPARVPQPRMGKARGR